ncbi:hypothetical protein G6F57_010011 [Rhizopus arrhizus]|uniref:Uncharacterized protein n=1 Tax=Rhizopus oryzae TaxID=64495 RepID=A0A9P6X2B5_RHIOR|nr:hypothetical protein G6F24_009951 [Rhizopus arrhizus]KAG1414181.1 hypothetical protein G6F58_007088 [Rhizopus delemar]KAG0784524.1 hypothetical protein G6F21_009850 [Rhizopus arrhizus]KAG0807367.1 hypothetical protein G6F20_010422 [Rhizopus arrhizus]KAG0824178.1 hypothetical protein G6F19_010462 [Rhizopus arrhizus]
MVKRLTNELSAAKSSSIWLDDVIQLLQLCDDLKDEERHVLQAIVELISSLYDCNMKTPSESHLASSYVHPFIHGLFSSKHPSKIAHCSNLMVDEQTSTNTRLCKDAIDNFNLSTTIGFQVVGKTIAFFAMNLQYKHLYTFTEIVSLEISLKKSDLLNLVGRFDDLATLSYIHDNLCTPSTRDISHLRIETSQYVMIVTQIPLPDYLLNHLTTSLV